MEKPEINKHDSGLYALTILAQFHQVAVEPSQLKHQFGEAGQPFTNKAQDINARQVLHAPVSGKVQQLAVTTIGGVVQPAQVLMLIVPEADMLEVEASIQNKDIGFVHVGQKAEVKVNTFPYTRYGVIDATVVDVSKDAVALNTPANNTTEEAKQDEKQQGLIYKMRLRLAKNWLMVDGRKVELIPGMAVSAEVKTGKRRLIEYFLSPLVQHVGESVRER